MYFRMVIITMVYNMCKHFISYKTENRVVQIRTVWREGEGGGGDNHITFSHNTEL